MRVLEASVDRARVRRHQVQAVAPHIDILLIAAQQQTIGKAARADEAIGLAQPAVANSWFATLRTSFVQGNQVKVLRSRKLGGTEGALGLLPAPDAGCEALLLELQRRGVGG